MNFLYVNPLRIYDHISSQNSYPICHDAVFRSICHSCQFAMLLLVIIQSVVSRLSCKNADGDDVDWWAMFKKPMTLDYYYRDENTGLSRGPGDLGQKSQNPLYLSIEAIYDGSTVGYLLVNDQAPTGDATSRYAHDKAVILYDADSAVYIEHSVPRFPPVGDDGYSYPDSGKANGQSFLCMSLTLDQLDTVANNILVEIPHVYDSAIPSTLNTVPGVLDIINEEWKDKVDTTSSLLSVGSGLVKHYVKSRNWGKDSYKDLLITALDADGYSETWQNGSGGVLASDCSGRHNIYNIQKVKFPDGEWTSTKDHSKWAVVGDYVCIGGVNRVASQEKRGGQHFCVKDSGFAGEMKGVIEAYEQC